MTDYHHLSVAEKQAVQRERMREPAVVCPACETQTTAADLVAHYETRCPGALREPGPGAKWITWAEARKLGVKETTLSWWVRSGAVRMRGEFQAREYLLRDVATRLVQAHRRRKCNKLQSGKER